MIIRVLLVDDAPQRMGRRHAARLDHELHAARDAAGLRHLTNHTAAFSCALEVFRRDVFDAADARPPHRE